MPGAWRTPGVGHLIGELVGYFTRNFQFIFVYSNKSFFLLLLGAPALWCDSHRAQLFILTVRINYRAMCLTHFRVVTTNRGKMAIYRAVVRSVSSYHGCIDNARVCHGMPKYARVCQSMQEYARVCKSMPEYARVCHSMPKYARVCQSMSEYARLCKSMPEYAGICKSMP